MKTCRTCRHLSAIDNDECLVLAEQIYVDVGSEYWDRVEWTIHPHNPETFGCTMHAEKDPEL